MHSIFWYVVDQCPVAPAETDSTHAPLLLLAAYDNNSGFPLTLNDTKEYIRYLADTAHAVGLQIALKNTMDTLDPEVTAAVDFGIDER